MFERNSLTIFLLTALLIMADGVNSGYFPCYKIVKIFSCSIFLVSKINTVEISFLFRGGGNSKKRSLLKGPTMIAGTITLLFTSTALKTSWRRNESVVLLQCSEK